MCELITYPLDPHVILCTGDSSVNAILLFVQENFADAYRCGMFLNASNECVNSWLCYVIL